MLVGIVIALIQALTQVQEMTLTFIPKIIVILVVVAVSGSFIGRPSSRLHRTGLRADRARLLISASAAAATLAQALHGMVAG